MPYTYEYPRPAVTVDLVVFGYHDRQLHTLLIRRKKDPFADRLAIPGGFLEMDEEPAGGARRELKEETGLDDVSHLTELGFFGRVDRDPRSRTISLAFVATARPPLPAVSGSDDATEATWFPIEELNFNELAFDHAEILQKAVAWLRAAFDTGPVALSLLSRTFRTNDMKALRRAVCQDDRRLTSTWFNRLRELGLIEPVADSDKAYRSLL
jgi:8-oxo-dGTP diphosphatase